ncbi:hypothetical protein [Salinivibrio kushneri]|uniref:hypothetical protein n=1 Tax=Salinivibrio kushneri TaxID=1908198 RepID=UPI001054E0FA|nr:hypothetical protein [Salinivibrio kushneri]
MTNALVVDSDIIVESGKKDLGLYKYGVPLSHQIALRYLQGLDLDIRPSVVDAVKGKDEASGICSYLLRVVVSHLGEGYEEAGPEINTQLYSEIES